MCLPRSLAIFWTPAPASRAPRDMLLVKCPPIAAGQASHGAPSCGPHFVRDFACVLGPHPGHPQHKLSMQGCSDRLAAKRLD
eukprot:1148097-Pelagomonas_calceolata.AAC.2